jgi:hypothetical protein
MVRTQAALEGKTNNKIETSEKKVVGMTKEMEERLAAEMEEQKKNLKRDNKKLEKQLTSLSNKFSNIDLKNLSPKSRTRKKNSVVFNQTTIANSMSNTPESSDNKKKEKKGKKKNKKESSKK